MDNISSLTLVLTERCNFSCPYCPQRRGKNTLSIEDITAFLDLMRSWLAKEVWLGFYGGEPLLVWPLVEQAVAAIRKIKDKTFHLSLTSNGSLLKKKHILFFKENRFNIVLSYDGLAQKNRDAKSVVAVEKALAMLRELYPHGYMVNSVFAPATVSRLATSMDALLQQGHQRLQYVLDTSVPWEKADLAVLRKQLELLAAHGKKHRQKNRSMPLENLKETGSKGVFACFAGRDRLALLPDRTVWGCYLFYDLLGHEPENPDYKKYCFGKLPAFNPGSSKNRAVTANYNELRQDYFFTVEQELCSLCAELENCRVCPVVAALATSRLGVIPAWVCRVRQVNNRIKTVTKEIH